MGERIAQLGKMIRFAAACAVAVLAASAAQADCREDRVDLRGPWGAARFSVEIADDDASRARGLMFRESLPARAGMLFIYETPRRAAFWMRNTLIPLDMIFVDETGRVARVHHEAIPHDETPIEAGENVLLVLEINGGLAAQLGISEGTELRHPRLARDIAVWPCP
ncbi:DUF192 domain-containing protein [Plastorhodobacter daqingensis]|uniref:DUF192 domain-containing protein n=1 Tax=Plastorhodobacter daqingensis TaxID=1387281 RepID=A0ABW2UHR3_9RHOB